MFVVHTFLARVYIDIVCVCRARNPPPHLLCARSNIADVTQLFPVLSPVTLGGLSIRSFGIAAVLLEA